MKVGDKVRWRAKPHHKGVIVGQDPLGWAWEVKWDDGWSSFFSSNDLDLLDFNYRPAYGAPAPAVCRCPIKDLTSVGHTNPQCPERKLK